jgi:hypothetical protein
MTISNAASTPLRNYAQHMVTVLPFIVNRGSDLFTMPLLLLERASGGKIDRGTPC